MPPRGITALIIAFWLTSLGWFAYREWLPWLQADSPPPFTVDLVDEAAPPIADWSIWRGDQKIGNLTTKLTAQKDGTFELHSTIENFKLTMALLGNFGVSIEIPKLTTVQIVTRTGELRSISSKLVQLALHVAGHEMTMNARLDGNVQNGKLIAQTRLESPLFGKVEQELEPIALESGSMFNPMQPVARLRVWPGQRWTITNFDPLFEALKASLIKAIAQQPGSPNVSGIFRFGGAKQFRVRVLDEPQNLVYQDKSISCYIVEYTSDDVTGRTWVEVNEGKVLRQEVTGTGEKLVLLRVN